MMHSHARTMILIPCLVALISCASVISSATSGMAANLSAAILNQDDPETVRDGAPAYLLMLDSFVEGAPKDADMLRAAAELYAAYGVLFVDDAARAGRLTNRSRVYADRALCADSTLGCNLGSLRYPEYQERLEKLGADEKESLYTYSLSWFAYIRANSGDMAALASLPRGEAALRRVQAIDPDYRKVEVEHYLGVLSTIRPPALGGQFEAGRAHFENALAASGGKNLSIKVDYARYYARTLYERELHDRLLTEVLETDPVQDGLTLFNVLAQRQARELLDSANDYF